MNKEEAARMYGSNSALSRALGVNRAAVSQWPRTLSTRIQLMVIGAAVRDGQLPTLPGETTRDAVRRILKGDTLRSTESEVQTQKRLGNSKDHATEFAETLRETVTALWRESRSSRRVAFRLNDAGIRTRAGKLWTSTQVTRVLDRLNLREKSPTRGKE